MPSQGVPRILLDCHVTLKAYWLVHFLLSYVTVFPFSSTLTHYCAYVIAVHSILSSDSPMTLPDSLLYVIYCGSPIILLFSQLGVGTSHLYIKATISLELGLKPNLVFNPRLVASPVSLLRVSLILESLQSPL